MYRRIAAAAIGISSIVRGSSYLSPQLPDSSVAQLAFVDENDPTDLVRGRVDSDGIDRTVRRSLATPPNPGRRVRCRHRIQHAVGAQLHGVAGLPRRPTGVRVSYQLLRDRDPHLCVAALSERFEAAAGAEAGG